MACLFIGVTKGQRFSPHQCRTKERRKKLVLSNKNAKYKLSKNNKSSCGGRKLGCLQLMIKIDGDGWSVGCVVNNGLSEKSSFTKRGEGICVKSLSEQ